MTQAKHACDVLHLHMLVHGCQWQLCRRTRWNLEPSGAVCSTGVDHIHSPLVHGLCVGPTTKPLLCPRSRFRMYDFPCTRAEFQTPQLLWDQLTRSRR